jgi:hypothetical protein
MRDVKRRPHGLMIWSRRAPAGSGGAQRRDAIGANEKNSLTSNYLALELSA